MDHMSIVLFKSQLVKLNNQNWSTYKNLLESKLDFNTMCNTVKSLI